MTGLYEYFTGWQKGIAQAVASGGQRGSTAATDVSPAMAIHLGVRPTAAASHTARHQQATAKAHTQAFIARGGTTMAPRPAGISTMAAFQPGPNWAQSAAGAGAATAWNPVMGAWGVTPTGQLASWGASSTTSSTGSGGGKPPAQLMSTRIAPSPNQAAFVKRMMPYANTVSKKTGLPTNFLLAQWSLESAYGTSQAFTQNANAGGIRPWGSTLHGADSKYAGYSSLAAFAQNDAAFYEQPRYRALLSAAQSGASNQRLVQLLQQSGYATSKTYGQEMLNMLQTIATILQQKSLIA